MTEKTVTPAEEYRALGRLMRYARSQGYTYHITTTFGRTDWSWIKDGLYVVVAEPLGDRGWRVAFNNGNGGLWPASVQQLTDVLVAVGLLPVGYSSQWRDGFTVANDAVYDMVKVQVAEWYDDLLSPVERGWPKAEKVGYLNGVADAVDNICDVIGAAHPEWDHMRDAAIDALRDAAQAGAR